MSTPWLAVLGFALCFAALFSKTWRINKIFHSPSLKHIKVTAYDVMAPLIVLLLVNLLILSLWTGLDPLKWEREVTKVDVFGQTVETEAHCESDSFAAFVSVLAVGNMGALVVAAYQAYKARDIALEFSESSYIGRAIGLFLLACLYGIPVLIITWDDPSARYFVLMILAFVCSMSVLLLIFVPKVIFDRRGGFKKASHVVSKQVTGSSRRFSVDGSSAFVSGFSTVEDSTTSGCDDSGEMGVRVVDNGRMREDLKRQNKKLAHESRKLQDRLQKLEHLSKRTLGYAPSDDEQEEEATSLSLLPEEKEGEEEEAPGEE